MKSKELFCQNCGDMRECAIVNKPQSFTVKGVEIEVKADAAVCAECGGIVFDAELDSAALIMAYDEFRKRHGLLFPSGIKEIREKYGLSQRGLARLLNWGEITIQRYESGAIQDQPHNDLLLLLSDPSNMKKLLERERSRLSARELNKIEDRLRSLLDKQGLSERVFDLIGNESSILTGYRRLDLSRFANTVLYFANACPQLFKTKLLKLLWYSDFLCFKRSTISLTGAKYVHFPLGPVPERYELLLGAMDGESVDIIPTLVYEHYGEEISPREEFNPAVFSREELCVLVAVSSALSSLNCSQISAYSHEEAPYLETKDKELISYEHAHKIRLV